MMDKKSERKWEVQNAMSTLQRAQDIQTDADLMKEVRSMASKEAKKFQALASGGSVAPKKTLKRK